ncbi:hypothetical protein DW1_0832 [Proteiniborus sp. DW1]|uniref:hypothetical protein n=1 Tax=Proteiniborus sp. DW1 TaxID=1889883 RepID=UPI00092E195E|nr:hypothetical protein [Proteiniborus sp. DW1]SCG82440.1 hypothetical protein DW1_0832 [Proteiniborus sp. DW1]
MYYIVIIMSIMTLLLFWGCIKTYNINGKVLVDGAGFYSIEFYWWIILASFLVLFITFNSIGKWLLLIFYLLWLIALFMNHWRYYFFGATEKKLKGYNDCFKNTIKVLKASERKIIPGLYHIILSIVVAVDFLVVLM